MRLAREVGLPLLGTSDSHLIQQFGTSYSLIEGEMTVASVLTAIKKGDVTVVTRPLTLLEWTRILIGLFAGSQIEQAKRLARSRWLPLRERAEIAFSGERARL